MNIYWYKMDERAIIPTKRAEDAGFDIYCIEDKILLMPGEKRLFSTGLAAAADPGWWLLAFDRGSTGSKGIHTHCGVIDNGYRGEIFICLANDNSYPVYFTRETNKAELIVNGKYYDHDGTKHYGNIFYYPLTKAIAQIIPIEQPIVNCYEATADVWNTLCNTERGAGKLGDSGK